VKIAMITSGGTRFDPYSFQHIAYLARYMASKGHAVTVIDYRHTGDSAVEQIAGMTIVRLTLFGLTQNRVYQLGRVKAFRISSSWMLERVFYTLSVLKYLRRRQFDAVYCNSTFISLVLVNIVPRLRRKLVYHSMLYPQEKGQRSFVSRLSMFIENMVARRVGWLVVEAEQAQDRIVSEAGVSKNKVYIIEPGVDISFWASATSVSSNNLIEQYQLNQRTVILFHARVTRRKGVDFLIRAANILINEKNMDNLIFLIVGPNTEGTTPSESERAFVEELSNLIRYFNLSDVVKLILGWQPSEVVRDFYAASDIYVLPTLSDLTPHTIKQAMIMGKPVVTTTASWFKYIVQDGQDAFLVEPGQERPLAEALEKLIIDRELREDMGIRSLQTAREQWDMVKQTERWEAIIQQICAAGH